MSQEKHDIVLDTVRLMSKLFPVDHSVEIIHASLCNHGIHRELFELAWPEEDDELEGREYGDATDNFDSELYDAISAGRPC